MVYDMELNIGNVLIIKNPDNRIKDYCKAKLELINPDYVKKQRMGFYTGKTPKVLTLYEEVGNTYILPYGCLRQILPYFKLSEEVTNFFATHENVDMGKPIPLYDYQEEAVNRMIYECYGILQSKAGSGKTQMGIAIAQKLGKRTLWLTHTIDLLRQSLERALPYIPNDKIGTITDGKINIGESITFATIQTMANIDLQKYKFMWDTIIVDECHRVCGTPTAMTQFSKVLSSLVARHKYGMSATVHRADGLIEATFALLGDVRYIVPDSATEKNVMPVGIKVINTGTGLSDECLNPDGTLYYTGMINHLAEDAERNNLITELIEGEFLEDHSILILSDRVAHLKELFEKLSTPAKHHALLITGDMQTKKAKVYRENGLEDMRNGSKKILFATYKLAKEGLDIPRLDRLIMATPQKDYAIVTQSIGRIARKYEGKKDSICYDLLDNITYCKRMYSKRKTSYKKASSYFV